MKKILSIAIALVVCSNFFADKAIAQGMHFSQYYNAPMLLNPANTALLPDNDFRVGVNYRKQWASVPVPYRTTSIFADFQAFRNRNLTNWLGLGLAFWSDKAGDGNLALTRTEAFIAYHVQMGDYTMLSAGVSGAYAQRKVDFNRFTFDQQWDGFQFNNTLASGETGYQAKTNYFDVAAGVNLSIYPNENFYLKIGAGVAHLTQPVESFYGMVNKMGIRPTGNIDALLKASRSVIINPSIYYTTQKGAMELVYGSQFRFNVSGADKEAVELIFGAYHRWGESIVGSIGLRYAQWKIVSSYDFTSSQLSRDNKGNGAFELSIIYQGSYNELSNDRRTLNCPRF